MPAIALILIKTLAGILMPLVTGPALKDFLLWAAGILVKRTDTPYDDELLVIIQKHLDEKDAQPKE